MEKQWLRLMQTDLIMYTKLQWEERPYLKMGICISMLWIIKFNLSLKSSLWSRQCQFSPYCCHGDCCCFSLKWKPLLFLKSSGVITVKYHPLGADDTLTIASKKPILQLILQLHCFFFCHLPFTLSNLCWCERQQKLRQRERSYRQAIGNKTLSVNRELAWYHFDWRKQ